MSLETKESTTIYHIGAEDKLEALQVAAYIMGEDNELQEMDNEAYLKLIKVVDKLLETEGTDDLQDCTQGDIQALNALGLTRVLLMKAWKHADGTDILRN